MRRLIAVIIDGILMGIAAQIVAFFIVLPALLSGLPFLFAPSIFLQGLFFFFYAAIMESMWGATLGKQIMNLRVTTTDGKPATIDKTLIRDVSKLHPLLQLIDTIAGMMMVGDPHRKFSDRFAGTTVVSTIERGMIFPTSQSPPPPPPTPPQSP